MATTAKVECSVPECDRPSYARGMCTRHYQRVMRNGDAQINRNDHRWTPNPDLVAREGLRAVDLVVCPGYERIRDSILSRCEPGDEGCWSWTGALNERGYGQFRPPKGSPHVSTLTLRALYAALVENPTPGQHLDHLCRNRTCCNPGHLDDVTPRTNLTRGLGPIAQKARAKVCVAGHRFDEANTHVAPSGRRSCRTCNARRQRETKARRLRKLSGLDQSGGDLVGLG